MRERDG